MLSAADGGRLVGLFGRACAVGYLGPDLSATMRAQVDAHHGADTERREIAVLGFDADARLGWPCPLVLHMPTRLQSHGTGVVPSNALRISHSSCASAVRLFGRASRDAGCEAAPFEGLGSGRMLIAKESARCPLTS